MQCPNCHATLVMTDRQGVEIDYCPQCRGVWLDRGELDKLIERASGPAFAGTPHQPQHQQQYQQHDNHQYRRDYDDDDDDHHERRHDGHHYQDGHHKKHKKESFLGDLFDF